MVKFEGKVAIVTGATRGIGKAIALALAREGADIVAAGRTTDDSRSALPGTADETARDVTALGRRGIAVKMDVTQDADVEAMVARALDEFGRIDILVNNAGINIPGRTLELAVKRWDLMMNVNLRGAYLCCRAVLPAMLKQGSGSILNISSLNARAIDKTRIPYGISKAGLEYLSRGLAEEFKADNISVNAIQLEFPVVTEGSLRVYPNLDMSRWGKPEVMGEAAVWVLSQASDSYTGRIVTIGELREEYAKGAHPS